MYEPTGWYTRHVGTSQWTRTIGLMNIWCLPCLLGAELITITRESTVPTELTTPGSTTPLTLASLSSTWIESGRGWPSAIVASRSWSLCMRITNPAELCSSSCVAAHEARISGCFERDWRRNPSASNPESSRIRRNGWLVKDAYEPNHSLSPWIWWRGRSNDGRGRGHVRVRNPPLRYHSTVRRRIDLRRQQDLLS